MRRALVSLLATAALCLPVQGQSQGKIYRLGVLAQADISVRSVRTFVLPELAKLGFVDGSNLVQTSMLGM
jgi:hypothetical protein